MNNLRKYLARIQTQLAGLTISQKLLILLLLVVMVGTIFFTVSLSAKPEMVVLIPQAMTSEEINRAEMYLKGKYDYQISGDKILVPAEKAYAIRGELFAAQALPKDTTVAFAELVKANNPFLTDSAQSRQWNYATQETLTKMLRYFPFVEDGTVIIAQGQRSTIGREGEPSSATVTLKVKNNEGLTTAQVTAIVDMVRGAVAGLKREQVHVMDGQRAYQVQSGDSQMPSDLLAYKKAIEDAMSAKLYTMFGDYGNVHIAVNAVPDLSTRKTGQVTYDPKGVVKAPTRETNQDSSTTDGPAGATGEPGVSSNVGANVGSSNTAGHKMTTTTNNTTTETDNRFGQTTTDILSPPGTEIKDLTASITIPRSYFLAIYRRIKHDPKADPLETDDAFKTLIEGELKKATSLAKNSIGAKTDDQIKVDWFDDTIEMKPTEIAAAGSFANGSVSTFLTQHAKQGVLTVLAIGVLGWMLMMVRRAVPAGAGADVDGSVFFGNGSKGGGSKGKKKSDANEMDVSDDVYGEANEGDAVLTGIELDDDTLQSRKMVDEVSTMIKENPENAATLVKRWMAKSK